MFDLQQVNAYRSVEAPEELRERVLTEANKTKAPRRSGPFAAAAALAACLLLVLGLSRLGSGPADLILMGEPLREGRAVVLEEGSGMPQDAVAYSRQVMPNQLLPVELELTLKKETTLEVSGGTASVLQDGEEQEDWTALAGNITVFWEIDPTQREQTYQLTMHGGDTCRSVTLSYEEDEGGWVARTNHTEHWRKQS